MGKKHLTYVALGFGVLILLVVFLFATTTAQRSGYIQLPESPLGVQGEDSGFDGSDSDLPLVEITPETVQQAIATLSRPAAYARTVNITTYWSDGSQSAALEVAVLGELTRVDSPASGGSTRHLLTNGETTGIWYDNEDVYSLFPSGTINADMEQRIPTYEDILTLEVSEIAVAVYGEYEGIYCISVLTEKNEAGYQTAYWISLDSGLLVAAETQQGETLVYRMTALTMNDTPAEEHFLLPDGATLPEREFLQQIEKGME